jgi:hypothetical protein
LRLWLWLREGDGDGEGSLGLAMGKREMGAGGSRPRAQGMEDLASRVVPGKEWDGAREGARSGKKVQGGREGGRREGGRSEGWAEFAHCEPRPGSEESRS